MKKSSLETLWQNIVKNLQIKTSNTQMIKRLYNNWWNPWIPWMRTKEETKFLYFSLPWEKHNRKSSGKKMPKTHTQKVLTAKSQVKTYFTLFWQKKRPNLFKWESSMRKLTSENTWTTCLNKLWRMKSIVNLSRSISMWFKGTKNVQNFSNTHFSGYRRTSIQLHWKKIR